MGALEILQAWLLKLCSQCQRGQQSSRWGDSTDSQGSLTWAPGQPELCVCSLVRLLEGAGQLPSAWWSKSKLLIIAYLSEVTHLNASCDNRSWCWWVSLPEDTIVAKSKKKKSKSKRAPGRQLTGNWVLMFLCPRSYTHTGSYTSCSALCRHDTEDRDYSTDQHLQEAERCGPKGVILAQAFSLSKTANSCLIWHGLY